MWKNCDEIFGDEIQLSTDSNRIKKCWILHAINEEYPETMYVWCDPHGERVLGFKSEEKADSIAEVLATHGMVVWTHLLDGIVKQRKSEKKTSHFSIGQTIH